MTRRNKRKSAASKVDSADSRKISSKSTLEELLIGRTSIGLKELFADQLIKDNDESDVLIISDDEENQNTELNSEQLKNQEMTNDAETEDKADANQTKGYLLQYTYNDTWCFIKPHSPIITIEERQLLGFPLVKLANDLTTIQLPSTKWSYNVILKEMPPRHLEWNTLIFTGDLKKHKIPEEDRAKYLPSYVTFLREGNLSSKSHVIYDRIISFNKSSYSIKYEGKLIHLDGAPEMVNCKQDVEMLLDILDSILLSNHMIDIVAPKK